MREILCGNGRFNDIRRGIPRISRAIFSERLKALVLAGAIERTDGPNGQEYALTEAGQELAILEQRTRQDLPLSWADQRKALGF